MEVFNEKKIKSTNYVAIDYIKVETIDYDNRLLLKDERLKFIMPVDVITGEVKIFYRKDGQPKATVLRANYKNISFTYYPDSDRMEIAGSLHVLYNVLNNRGEQNHDDFSIKKFEWIVNFLSRNFGLTPSKLFIRQLEFGVNINLAAIVELDDLITNVLLHTSGRGINFVHRIDNKEGRYIIAERKKNYAFKIYDKGLKENLNINILRLERKQISWRNYCKKYKIGQTLDCLRQNNFIGMSETFILDWESILIVDPKIFNKDSDYFKYGSKHFWDRSRFKTHYLYNKQIKELRELNIAHGQDIQGKIRLLIEDKIAELNKGSLRFSSFSYRESTTNTYKDITTINNDYEFKEQLILPPNHNYVDIEESIKNEGISSPLNRNTIRVKVEKILDSGFMFLRNLKRNILNYMGGL